VSALSTLDISSEHLAQTEALYRAVLADAQTPRWDIVASAREHIRETKVLLLEVQKARRGRTVMAIHARSHSTRLDLEQEWEQTLRRLSDALVSSMDFDAAIRAAHGAWIKAPATPLHGVLVMPGSRTLKSRLYKALTPPKREDLTRVERWGATPSEEAKRLLASSNPDAQVLVLRDAEGNAVGLTEVTREHGVLRVQSMVVEPGTEYGPQMMQEVAKVAQKEGLGISMADVSPDAESFFKGLGMRRVGTTGGEFEWSPREAAGFAASGGTLPPPGASTAGMGTGVEQMGMQQLALNILQGVPKGAQATAADVQRALMNEREAATWINGGASQYIGLATKTADAAGQVSLDHLGLGKNWTFATPRNMAQDTFEVRGSKIIQQMYGNHRDTLTRIITDATNPTKPLSMSEVQARIKEEWPALQRHQVERIARTETGAVWMGTAANAYAANGISQFETIVATGPSIGVESEDPCDECVDMAQGVHSMDDDLPPWHPNCRCDVIPVLEDPETGDAWLPPDEPWTGGGEESGAAETAPKPLPAPPERDMPMLPPEAASSPDAVAPSADIQLKGQGARDTTEAALAEIGTVHNVPDYLERPVVRGSTNNAYARDANEILLNPRPRGTGLLGEDVLQRRSVVHEYGHYVQEQKIVPMNTQIAITDMAEATPEFASFARYDAAPDELFARAYQQWIAERSADEAALADYKKIGTYWSKESFAPIGDAFDRAFEEKGLLRGPPRVPTEPTPLPKPEPLPEPAPKPEPTPEPKPEPTPESAPPVAPEPHSIPMDRGGSPGMVSPAAKAEMSFRDTDAKERAREALGVIGRVIRLPADAPEFKIVRGDYAKMKPGVDGAPAEIHGISKFYTQSERATFTHEFGHYLDWGVLGNPADTEFATQVGKEADAVLKVIHDTDEYKALRASSGRDRTYLGSDIELFARSFEQYIGEVTGDADINYAVDVARRLENANQFWTKETFAPIKDAFDNMFRERGMLIERVDTPAVVPAAAPPVQLTIPTAEPPVAEVTSEGDPFRRYWKVPESTSEPFGITAHGLTNEELGAIDRYTGQDTKGGYNVVNRWLRGLDVRRGNPLAEIKDAVAKLDTAIEKAPALDKPMTLYRGVANTDFYGGVPKVGQVIHDPAFMSTSTTPALPTSWAHTHGDIWTIDAPAGTRGINVNAALEGTVHGPIGLDPATAKEKEIILARGQRLVVDSVMPRVTEYPATGQKITAYDVKAHIETEPPPPSPPPKPEPKPEVPKEPTPAPPPPPAPTPPPATGTRPPMPVEMTTKEHFEQMLQHYDGRTIRVKMSGRSYSGLVKPSTRGNYMTLNGSRFINGFDRVESVEVKVGGRFKPYKEFERMTPEQQNPEPRATDSSKPRGKRTVVEPPPPVGGFKFDDAAPSMKLGDVPPTPKFASIGEAKAFAEKHIAAQVDFGSNPDLAGIQQALDGMAQVLRPYGIKLDRFQVEKPKGQALAIFGRGQRRITIDGVKQYFSGNIIQAQKRVTNLRDMAENNIKQREVFASNQQITREEIQKRLENPSYPEALREDAAKKLENLAVTKRWTVNHSVDDPVRALLAHESGHFLDHAYNLRNVFAENLKAEGYTFKDGLQLSEYGATQVSEVWAETTAANIVGVEVPPLIQRAYEKTLASISRADVEAKMKETEERHAAVLNTQKQREHTLALRKRVGLH
jgi:hypothetical protein